MAVGIRSPDLRDLAARLKESEAFFKSPTPLLKAWGVTVLGEIDRNFQAGGRPAWKPLAASTIAARRQGKGGGSAQPLQDTGALRKSFDYSVAGRTLTVFSNAVTAVFAEFGTRAHAIVAKTAQALAIPTGAFTLAGLGGSRATGRGSFIFTPKAGQKIPKRLRGRVGKAVAPFKGVIFRKRVNHPGTVPRPVLPTPEQIVPKLVQVGEAFLLRTVFRQIGR